MKQVSLLRGYGVAASFLIIMIVAIANNAHAQTGSAGTAADPAEGSAVEQPKSGWNEAAQDRGSWLSRIFGRSTPASPPSPASPASGKTDAAGWSSQGSENSGCISSTGEEDFLCKLARLFWGPDTPQGPNQDMDSNITAGGAGG